MDDPTIFGLKIAILAVYLLCARASMRSLKGMAREVAMVMLGFATLFMLLTLSYPDTPNSKPHEKAAAILAPFCLVIVVQYVGVWLFATRKGLLGLIPIFLPIVILCFFRYSPPELYRVLGRLLIHRELSSSLVPIGLSYVTFRACRLIFEIRNGSVKQPGFWEFVGYCSFLPSVPVGPISTYAEYRLGFEQPYRPSSFEAFGRIAVGFVKWRFLGALFNRLGYQELLLDSRPHGIADVSVAIGAYFLFLYCNFSGFCDMAVGSAAIIGISVPENFNMPYLSRNVREFWTRWHITLGEWMREVVFAPLSKAVIARSGVQMANYAVAVAIFVVFLLIGIWHGVGWNYFYYGLVHAVAVVFVHFYTIFLKNRLGRNGFKAYNENRLIRSVATCLTVCFCAASMIFFANSMEQIAQIWRMLF